MTPSATAELLGSPGTSLFSSHNRGNLSEGSAQLATCGDRLQVVSQQGGVPSAQMFGVFIAPLANYLISKILGSNAGILTGLASAVATTSDLLRETGVRYQKQEDDSETLIMSVVRALASGK